MILLEVMLIRIVIPARGNSVQVSGAIWIIEQIQRDGHHVVQKTFMLIFLLFPKEVQFA